MKKQKKKSLCESCMIRFDCPDPCSPSACEFHQSSEHREADQSVQNQLYEMADRKIGNTTMGEILYDG